MFFNELHCPIFNIKLIFVDFFFGGGVSMEMEEEEQQLFKDSIN